MHKKENIANYFKKKSSSKFRSLLPMRSENLKSALSHQKVKNVKKGRFLKFETSVLTTYCDLIHLLKEKLTRFEQEYENRICEAGSWYKIHMLTDCSIPFRLVK